MLRLEPLDEPGVEIEHTRRGAAVHRAFARFHKRDRTTALLEQTQLPDRLTAELEQTVLAAVEEYATRAASAASKMLWRLEGKRLLRSIARYRGHWEEFRGPWQEKGMKPIPHELEAEFGLPANPGETKRDPLVVTIGDVEVRIGGKIDRVDIAELPGGVGFWVIDYKTGSGQYYTGSTETVRTAATASLRTGRRESLTERKEGPSARTGLLDGHWGWREARASR